MVVHESFVTRKPMEFTIIVLFIIFILLIPIYFFTKDVRSPEVQEDILVTESYNEVTFLFSSDSDFSESDKRHMFKFKYEGNFVQWTGTLLACNDLGNLYRLSIDEDGDGMGDVLFTSYDDCAEVPPGSTVTYKTRLIDWKITTFIGKDGEVLSWS